MIDTLIFSKTDFILCEVRVPSSYPQSQTHSGIAYWGGKLYLTCSPFPAKKLSRLGGYWQAFLQKISGGQLGKPIDAERFENPILYSAALSGSEPPVFFEPESPFPLMDTPKPIYGLPAYNSDPDIFIEDGEVYILNRTYYRRPLTNGKFEKEILISLIRGTVDENGYHYNTISEFKRTTDSFISPCLTKYKGEYLLTHLETNSAINGHSFDGLFIQKSQTVEGLRENGAISKVEIESDDLLPWHMSVFTYKDRLFTVIACVKKGDTSHIWQMLGAFDENLTFLKIFPRPLTDYNSYRGAAIVVNGEFVLYSTTLNDKVKGSRAVDGRDIIMAKMPMEKLFKELKLE